MDDDGDGFTELQGDCNDCDPNINPGAVDIISVDGNGKPLPDNQQVDEDCDGTALLPSTDISCDNDSALALASTDPIHAARAMDICKLAQNGSWGIVSAKWIQADGTALPSTANAALGHGILPGFGPNVAPERGVRLLGLSSGTARRPGDPGYQSSFSKGYSSSYPAGVPFPSTSCPGVNTGTPFDSIGLELQLKVPTNAKSFTFKTKFYTSEFPGFICSTYNDIFLATMNPPPAGASPTGTSNIAFDATGEPLSVNNAFLDVCSPQTAGGKTFSCPAGTAQLQGTGFETHGGTTYVTTTAPVVSGSTITLRFMVWDSGDGILDSTVLLDDFRWSAEAGQLGTRSCTSGGIPGEACNECIAASILGDQGCCNTEWQACLGNTACQNLYTCMNLCTTTTCKTNCQNTYAAGKPQYDPLSACLFGTGGANVGSCGKVCP
ncbi:MAG: putative metal-binding motif-containing protein [Polyangiaceae bacterium]|nr:putative metal-binding motif-containing protein [Polyangiaceae bacterium]